MNLEIENFRNSLINLLNTCNLPVGTAVYIMKDVYNLLIDQYKQILEEEKKAQIYDEVECEITPDNNSVIVIEEEE